MIKISKAEFMDYMYITFATLLYAFAVSYFLLPYKLATGGVTGIGVLIYYATGFGVENSYFIINVGLLILAIKELGWKFCVKTIYAVVALSFSLWLGQRVYEFSGSPMVVGDELSMACIIGALLEGVALAICFMAGGSTGGTDIIAAIVNKYRNMSLGTVIMIFDILIISSCYVVFHDIHRVIFGYVLLVVSSITLDYCVNRSRQSVEFKIYSRNPKAIAEAIIKTGRGVTLLEGLGYYTKSERKVIVSVVRKREQVMWLQMIKAIDPYAFVTMGNVSGVWGEGFDAMKVKEKGKTKRKIVVLADDNPDEATELQILLGDNFTVRTLSEIGCDTSKPITTDILSNNAVLKARFVKNFYGYDCVAYGVTLTDSNENVFAVATGDAFTNNIDIDKFNTIEEVKAFLHKQK